jgi:hypothetical protein
MSRTWLLFLICLSILILLAPLSRASLTVRVNDPEIKIFFDETATRVVLPVENDLNQPIAARIKLELLDPNGASRATVERNCQLSRGRNELTFPIALWLKGKSATSTHELLWYRLRYQIAPASAAHFDSIANVVSLSEITPDIFAVNVASARKAHEGSTYRLRVKTAHPLTAKPVSGVSVEAQLKFDGYDRDDVVLKQSAHTDASGFATIDFQIPRDLEDNDGDLEVTAHRGVLSETANTEVELDRETQIMVTTDKPLYQPGQIVHTRILMFDSSRRAISGEKATVKISDPESSTTFRAEVTSSRFGVASSDWQVPENVRLGDYSIEVKLESDKYEDAYGRASVKISRYDLPNFTVNVKADRPYYLPDQNAEVDVSAAYLFGQAVKRGHVRVVRETERRWNYREQKYETEEGDKYEGDTDGAGKFVARINLSEEHKKLKDEDYSRYTDLSYAAYFTDPTSNRTEQRRFDLRITKEGIHIYVLTPRWRQARDFPLQVYLSTSYADGSPASCEVAIKRVWEEEKERSAIPLGVVKTNRYGLAKLDSLILPGSAAGDDDAQLSFTARDDRNQTGNHTESIDLDDRPIIRITTDKPLYRDGEPIRAQIIASRPNLTLALDAITEEKVVQSQLLSLKNGRAAVVIPYRPAFAGTVTLAAYTLSSTDNEDDSAESARTVLYPHDRDLKLNVALSQESYRPGEDANASFLTRLAAGGAAESVLGVVILDKSVEERARTDRDFGGAYDFYRAYRYLSNDSGDVAGITRKDLDHLDLSKPLPDGLDLVAEVLLTNYMFAPHFFQSERYNSDAARIFADFIKYQIDPLKDRLDLEYKTSCDYPTTEQALRRFALTAGVSFDELRDPWEMPYSTSFFPQGAADVLQIASAGPDKRFGTDDDFTVLRVERPYFRFVGEAIDRAVPRYHSKTGGFIRDAAALKNELRHEGIDFDSLRDPWGEPFRVDFKVSQTKFQVLISSSGPDRRFAPKSTDDIALWTSSIDYAADLQAKIDAALVRYFRNTSQFPQGESEFNAALTQSRFSRDDLRDAWGNPYYLTFQQTAVYGNRVNVYNYATYGDKPKERTELTPVTQQMTFLNLRSRGEDGKENTPDDFTVATFSRLLAEQAGNESTPQPVKTGIILPGSTGAITGTVTDPNGAAVPGTKITAKNVRTTLEYMAETGDDGTYIVKNLPAGNYEVRFDASAFKRTVITDVFVKSSNITRLNVALDVAGVTETVTVTAGAADQTTVNATVAQISSLPNNGQRAALSLALLNPGAVNVVTKSGASIPAQLSTPRLREYFPETLVWQPSLETDKQGRAQMKFKLADNITTWKMSVIGSTEDGRIGIAEKEIKAFQPFFVDHDPPRVLTEGDEISVPVVVRNYLAGAQTVNLQIKPESWFTLLGPATQNVNVPAGDAARGIFAFRARASVKDGKQRITALASEANDAIERPVTVHPDGEEKSASASDIVSDQATLMLNIPATAIPNSTKAELKIYPNLLAHVTESVEAIMARPYGCGEQTISSTYPSLLWLKNYKRIGAPVGAADLHSKAEKYLRAGYARLLNYQAESGGFTYWGRGEPDIALTAYALRFLSEASEVAPVDDDVINRTRDWLIKQQRADGSWAAHDYWDKTENSRRSAILTAYVARVLAMNDPHSSHGQTTANKVNETELAVKRALDYLGARVGEIDEPYLIASYTLALIDSGDRLRAGKMIAKLRTLAHEENGAAYWALETNTPFYGWGLAGRVETTALVVQALSRFSQSEGASVPSDQSIDRGLLFLLREKDRYGVWYSTQATINVLDALLALLARDVNAANVSRTAEILVNGRSVKSIDLPEANRLVGPMYLDLTPFAQAGSNRVEIRRPRGSAPASIQAVAIYYLPWRESVATQQANWRANGSSGLRLVTKFDKTEAAVSDEITCHVEAERIGFSGYGMMLAEIGLPPGADVDRASLETAMKGSDWSISRYDVLPDRVVLYLWPRAGGTKFDFKFKPRFGLNAQSAASIVYDYYNPEARAIVEPVRFVVK